MEIFLGLVTFLALILLIVLTIIGFIILDRTKHLHLNYPMLESIQNTLDMFAHEANMDPTAIMDNNMQMYRSADGKHSANSLEELIEKMKKDADNPLSDEEAENLRNIFNEIEMDDDDDDDPDEPWKK